MVLGHEASGVVLEIGEQVTNLKPGDRVCMEPGIPNPTSRASREGHYNLDPSVRFWATPPIHGCLIPEVVHPAAFTFKLPDNVSLAEGAMIEPLAVGIQAATKANFKPGDTAVVIGAGPIGILTALASLAAGASHVAISDISSEKLAVAAQFDGLIPVNVREASLQHKIEELTDGWGADVVLECSGAPAAFNTLFDCVAPGGRVVLVGIPVDAVPLQVAAAQAKEATIATVFRYANVYEKAIALIASGKIDVKPLISATFTFEQSVAAFERAAEGRPADVKLQISLLDGNE
jgi:D-xylulose reductase